MAIIDIDSTWLSNNGGPNGPFILSGANNTYRMTTDVIATKTGFIAVASGITLDMNGRTLTYNNLPPPIGINGEFESDSIGFAPSGWDVSKASGLRVANNDAYLFGNKSLLLDFPGAIAATLSTGNPAVITTSSNHNLASGDHALLTGFSASQSIVPDFYPATILSSNQFTIPVNVTSVSDANGLFAKAWYITSNAISVPQSGYSYAASVSRSQIGGTQNGTIFGMKACLLNSSNVILASGLMAGEYNGISSVVHYTPPNTSSVYMRVFYGGLSTSSGSFYMDAARFRTSYDYGILCAGLFNMPGNNNLPSLYRYGAASGYNNCTSFSIICSSGNGSVIQGSGHGFSSSPIMAASLRNALLVSGVNFYVYGDDTSSIIGEASEASATNPVRTILDCGFYYASGIDVTTRYSNMSVINFSANRRGFLVDNCIFSGFPQVGVVVTSLGDQSGSHVTISNNTFYPNSIVTNAYSISVTATNNVDIFGNTITAGVGKSGRGITLDAYDAFSITGVNIYGNYVNVYEKPAREYGPSTTTRALRIRNNASGFGAIRDVNVYDNTFIAHTASGYNTDAFGCRISLRNDLGGMSGCNIFLYNNTFASFRHINDDNYQAIGLVFDGIASSIYPFAYGNTCESNDVGLKVVDSDGGTVRDIYILDTLIQKTPISGVNIEFKSIEFGFFDNQASNINIINTTYSNNITSGERRLYWRGSSTFSGGSWPYRQLFTGYGLNIRVVDDVNNPITNAIVSVSNPTGQIFNEYTGIDGYIDYFKHSLLPNYFPIDTYSYRQGDPVNQQTSASIIGYTDETTTPTTKNDLSLLNISVSKSGYSNYVNNSYILSDSGVLTVVLSRLAQRFLAINIGGRNIVIGT